LQPKCDEPLSNFAFKVNLRRYTLDEEDDAIGGFLNLLGLDDDEEEAGAYTRPLLSSS